MFKVQDRVGTAITHMPTAARGLRGLSRDRKWDERVIEFGVATIIVKLNGVGLRAACQEIGVAKIIAPALTAAAEIRDALTGFSRLDFSLVSERGELHFVDLDASAIAGAVLGDLQLLPSAYVVGLIRNERLELPRPDTRLEAGDVLLVLVDGEKGREAALRALSGS